MDYNYNFNQSLNGSLDFSSDGSMNQSGNFAGQSGNFIGQSGNFIGQPIGNLQGVDYHNLTHEQLVQMQQINQQQIQQLTAQMARMQSPVVTPTSPAQFPGQVFAPNVMHSPRAPRAVFQPSVYPTTSTTTTTGIGVINPVIDPQFSPNGNIPNLPVSNLNGGLVYSQSAYPDNSAGINGQIQTQARVLAQVNLGQFPLQERNVEAPNSLPLANTHAPRDPTGFYSSNTSTPRDSPALVREQPQAQGNDVTEDPKIMGRPRQQMSTRPPSITTPFTPLSDRSSLSSTASSPASAGYGPISPDSSWSEISGPRSPEMNLKIKSEGDVRSPIQNKPLLFQTRYPQDKCYSCMKKVYKMESIGPVKGVVYHKGCFRCKTCHTQLTMKNFNHSQSDTYDLAVYCKSHQPTTNDKGPKLDAESLEIKSALAAPKKGTLVPESERVPVHSYSLDINSREIEHARKVPVQNLQGGNKFRSHAWSKSKREQMNMPPSDIVRYDDPVSEVDPDSYNRYEVENSPDYL